MSEKVGANSIEPLGQLSGYVKWRRQIMMEFGQLKLGMIYNVLSSNQPFNPIYEVIYNGDSVALKQQKERMNKRTSENESRYYQEIPRATTFVEKNLQIGFRENFLRNYPGPYVDIIKYFADLETQLKSGIDAAALIAKAESKLSRLEMDKNELKSSVYYNAFMDIRMEMESVGVTWTEDRYKNHFLKGLNDHFEKVKDRILGDRMGTFATVQACYAETFKFCCRSLHFLSWCRELKDK